MESPNIRNNVAAMIHRHSSPARGWPRGMLRIRTSNEWPYGQWRQIAAATVGCTMFWVVPFTPTGSTSNVAGGRLPPLRYICYKYRVFNVSIHVLRFGKCEKRGTLPPLHQNCHKYRIFYVPHAVFAPFHTLFHNPWTGCGIFSGGKPKSVNFA